MDILAIQGNDERLLATGLDRAEVNDLRDWFCYTKPVGEDMIVIARSECSEEVLLRVHVSGTQSASELSQLIKR